MDFRKTFMPLILLAILIIGFNSLSRIGYQQISMEEATKTMATLEEYIILDVRTAEEYQQRHILGALNIPNEAIGDSEPAALPDKQQHIFVYCRSGNRSKQAAKKLAEMGYKHIYEIGGIDGWPGQFDGEDGITS